MTGHSRRISFAAAAVVIVLVCALLPWIGAPYLLVWIFLFSLWLTLADSYDIVGGHMGYMNLGHCAFFGLGAYAAAMALNRGFSLPSALGLAVLVAALCAAVVSYPLFRLRGAYFALATFGLLGLVAVIVTNLRGWTGGSGGISTPPGDHTVSSYYLSVVIAASTVFLSYRIYRSRFGLALRMIRDDEEVARSLGTPVTRYKCAALVVSSIPAGLIGGVYTWHLTYISPDSVFGLETALSPVVMAMLGGTGTLAGPLVGVCFVTIIQEFLWTKMPYFHLALYGAIMVCVGLFMPGGLVRTRWLRGLHKRLSSTEAASLLTLSRPWR